MTSKRHPARPPLHHQALSAAILALGVAACAAGPTIPGTRAPTASPVELGAPAMTEEEVGEAIAFRRLYGLRADEGWVRKVAENPASREGWDFYGVPLLPSEFADLQHRGQGQDNLEEVRSYGQLFPDQFSGAYYDSTINAVTVSFTADIERHRTALSNLLPRDARVEVRKARWSSAQLNAFAADVNDEASWFDADGVIFEAAGRRVTEDFVYVRYQGAPDAAERILARFGNPPWLRTEWLGPLPWTGPRADLTVIARDQGGRPIAGLHCANEPEEPLVERMSDTPVATDAGGRCVLTDVPVVVYNLSLSEQSGDSRRKVVAESRIAVGQGGTVVPVIVR